MPIDPPNAARIRMLPIHVANQIAAGEVVERPASVVKELVENAIDAGATRVDVTVTAGGRKLVSVADDGCGMVRDDALMSIERQASKLRTTEDIEHIHTMGFRGEALASIAAVSRFLLRTRTAGAEAGTEVDVVGGSLHDVRDCGCPVGTAIEVRDLFFNLPARRKFLRTFQTEQAQIRATFVVQALAHPGISMNLRCDGEDVHRLPPCESFADRLRDLYGPDTLANLRPVDGGAAGVRVTGFVGLPTWTRSDRAEQFLFVNHRPAAAPILYHALREAYPPLDGDRKPVVFLFVDLPPEGVDVNVHPTKREVRFRRPADVRDAVLQAVSRALGRTPPSIPDGPPPAPSANPPPDATVPSAVAPRIDPLQHLPFPPSPHSSDPLAPPVPRPQAPLAARATDAPPCVGTTVLPAPAGAPWAWCRLLGRLGERYALFETNDGYVVLDPRAAHARVLYEHLLRRDREHPSLSQRLLLPQSVELPADDAQRVRAQLPTFLSMGFEIAPLDADAFLVDALPDVLGEIPCRPLLIDVAKSLEEAGPKRGRERWREEAIAKAASLAAVDSRDSLGDVELVRLVSDLAACQMPYTCPRGRPTMVFTSYRELARRFGSS
jgi:DNA mismatch repair protein MutL